MRFSSATVHISNCCALTTLSCTPPSCFLSCFGVLKPGTTQPLLPYAAETLKSVHLLFYSSQGFHESALAQAFSSHSRVFFLHIFSSMKNPYHTVEGFLNFIACGESMLCSSSCSQPLTSSKPTSKIIYVHCFQPLYIIKLTTAVMSEAPFPLSLFVIYSLG